MEKLVALLRGINVGGKNKIKMADLKDWMTSYGFSSVQTYIQSGNLIFETDLNFIEAKEKLEKCIFENSGLSIPAILRTEAEFQNILTNCPFSESEQQKMAELNQEGESFYFALFEKEVSKEELLLLEKHLLAGEKFQIQGSNGYLLLPHSIRNSKFANKLNQPANNVTIRNYKTMCKIRELLQ